MQLLNDLYCWGSGSVTVLGSCISAGLWAESPSGRKAKHVLANHGAFDAALWALADRCSAGEAAEVAAEEAAEQETTEDEKQATMNAMKEALVAVVSRSRPRSTRQRHPH